MKTQLAVAIALAMGSTLAFAGDKDKSAGASAPSAEWAKLDINKDGYLSELPSVFRLPSPRTQAASFGSC